MPVHNSFNFSVPQPGSGGLPQCNPGGMRIMGPVLPIQIEIPTALAMQLQQTGQAIPTPVSGFGLVDTGASVSAVHEVVIQQLGVQPVGIANVGTAGGPQQQATYPARFSFPGTNLPTIEFGQLLGANLTGQSLPGIQAPLIALLGRDILEHFVVVYNGPAGMYTMAF